MTDTRKTVLHRIDDEFSDALLARVHKKYAQMFVEQAEAGGLEPDSSEFMSWVVWRMVAVDFSDLELEQFCTGRNLVVDVDFVRRCREKKRVDVEQCLAEIDPEYAAHLANAKVLPRDSPYS